MSNIPEKQSDGFRYYCSWAGNERGTGEDITRCVATVSNGGRSCLYHQCRRKRGYGPKGLLCKQHAVNKFIFEDIHEEAPNADH